MIEQLKKLGDEFLVNGHRSTGAPSGQEIAFGKHAAPEGDFADGGITVFDVTSRTTTKLTDEGKDPAWLGGEGRWISIYA